MTDSSAHRQARTQLELMERAKRDAPRMAEALASSILDEGDSEAIYLFLDYAIGIPRDSRSHEIRDQKFAYYEALARSGNEATREMERDFIIATMLMHPQQPVHETELRVEVLWLKLLDELVGELIEGVGEHEQAIREQLVTRLDQPQTAKDQMFQDQIVAFLREVAHQPKDVQGKTNEALFELFRTRFEGRA